MIRDLITPPSCKDCGDGPIFHSLTYTTILLNELLDGVFGAPARGPARLASSWVETCAAALRWITPRLLDAGMRLGIAKRIREPDADTQLLALMVWNEATKRGIVVEEFRLAGLPSNIFVARYPHGKFIAFEGIPLPPQTVMRVGWMDDKAILKEELAKLGFPVAKGGAARTLRGARKVFQELTPPVIVKPYSGSASRHTTLHVQSEEELVRAFRIATQVAPRAVIEEELVGPVYRATVVDGVCVAVLRRDQPHVVGDGVSTVEQLVEQANMHPKRQGPYFHHMKLDESADQELLWQGYTRESVLAKGVRATLHQKINWSVGGTTADVTDDVHGDNKALFEDATRVLGAAISGIDFIIGDISRSWKEQERCGILECNSMPFFDNHHLPFEGEPRNVAAAIWDMCE